MEVKWMKKINANEMRAVEGGVTYATACGATFTDKTPWKLAQGLAHVYFCSTCMLAKKRYGRWYTFNSKSALARAPW